MFIQKKIQLCLYNVSSLKSNFKNYYFSCSYDGQYFIFFIAHSMSILIKHKDRVTIINYSQAQTLAIIISN